MTKNDKYINNTKVETLAYRTIEDCNYFELREVILILCEYFFHEQEKRKQEGMYD